MYMQKIMRCKVLGQLWASSSVSILLKSFKMLYFYFQQKPPKQEHKNRTASDSTPLFIDANGQAQQTIKL